MPLNLHKNPEGEGGFAKYIKLNAKAGRWFVRAEWSEDENSDVEVEKPRMAIDLARIRGGWFCFPVGSAPVKHIDIGDHVPPQPQAIGERKFRRGFQVICFVTTLHPISQKPIGLREWSATANAIIGPILDMHAWYERESGAYPGMIPVYQCTGMKLIKGAQGDNYEPIFEFDKWQSDADIPGLTDMRMEWNKEIMQARAPDAPPNPEPESQVPPQSDPGQSDIPF